jgi:acetyl esterase/lipase
MALAMRASIRSTAIATYLALSVGLFASSAKEMKIWPNGAPGPKNAAGPEVDKTKPSDDLVGGKRLIRLGNVSDPTISLFLASPAKNTGSAVVVFPGGGYQILALDLEGTEVCQWLNTLGINAILLKYRVPQAAEVPKYQAPLQDAQRAMGIVRLHAKEWHIDAHRVGVLGFSAGGDLAAVLSNNFKQRSYPSIDPADQESCRPDFTVLVYPAYLVVKPDSEPLAPELRVSAETPSTFLVQTEDDPVHVENSLFYYLALKRAKVPAEMHLYSEGRHGYGLRPSKLTISTWPARAGDWFKALGLLDNPR